MRGEGSDVLNIIGPLKGKFSKVAVEHTHPPLNYRYIGVLLTNFLLKLSAVLRPC